MLCFEGVNTELCRNMRECLVETQANVKFPNLLAGVGDRVLEY